MTTLTRVLAYGLAALLAAGFAVLAVAGLPAARIVLLTAAAVVAMIVLGGAFGGRRSPRASGTAPGGDDRGGTTGT